MNASLIQFAHVGNFVAVIVAVAEEHSSVIQFFNVAVTVAHAEKYGAAIGFHLEIQNAEFGFGMYDSQNLGNHINLGKAIVNGLAGFLR